MSWLFNKKALLLLTGVALIALLVFVVPTQDWLADIKNWLKTLGLEVIPIFIGIYVFATVLGIPSALLILIAGTLFGLFLGVISVSIADILGASACFLLGRTVGREWIQKRIAENPKFAELDKALAQKGWKIILLTRLSPIVPSNILNYGFSLTEIKFWQYFLFSWLGMIPVIVLYVYIGSMGASLATEGSITGQLALNFAGLAVTLVATIYTTRLAKSTLAAVSNAENSEEEESEEESLVSLQVSDRSGEPHL